MLPVTSRLRTEPSVVRGSSVQLTTSTVVASACSRVMMALVKRRSSISSIQFGLGKSDEPGITIPVVHQRPRSVPQRPFPNTLGSKVVVPATFMGTGFCPGAARHSRACSGRASMHRLTALRCPARVWESPYHQGQGQGQDQGHQGQG